MNRHPHRPMRRSRSTPRPGRLPRLGLVLPMVALLACASVLGVRPLREQPFAHRAHVLEGVRCNQCHESVQKSDSHSPLDLPRGDTCLACHAEPHDKSACERCHGQPHRRAALQAAKDHLRFSHREHAGVDQGACMHCHGGVAAGDARLRPTMATCFSCHEHQQQWSVNQCDGCHRDMEGEQSRPQSHVVHGDDFVRHHGIAAANARDLCSSCHAESECTQCHGATAPVLPNVLRFDRTTNGQLHRAGFLARHSLEARADPGLCTTCHSEERCRSCHVDRHVAAGQSPRNAPHPPGWVGPPGSGNAHGREARRDPMSCASCHGGAGEALCVSCHRVGAVGGSPHPPGFEGGVGGHKRKSELPCRMCHGGMP